MGSGGIVLVNVAKVVLLLVNMAFMVGGAMFVYFSHKVKSSGWLEAFQGDYAWVGSTTFLVTLIAGGAVMAFAALGCFGALLRQKLLLTIYAGVLVLMLGFFVVIAYGAHSVHSKAEAWDAAAFPAVASEQSLGENFNRLYCAAQVPYYCVDADVNGVLGMFNQSLPGTFSSATTNVSAFCGVMNVPQVDTVCQVCELVSKYKEYTAVLDWAQEQCPRNAKNQVWCGSLLLAVATNGTSSAGSAVANNAPYGQCRPLFFALIMKWSSFLLGVSIGVCVATAAVIALALVLRCHRIGDGDGEKDDVRYSTAYARSNQRTGSRAAQPQQLYGGYGDQPFGSSTQQPYGDSQPYGGGGGYGDSQQKHYAAYGDGQQQFANDPYAYQQQPAHQQQQYGYGNQQQQQYGNAPPNQRASGNRFFI